MPDSSIAQGGANFWQNVRFSMDWIRGKFTGKSHIEWENLWFPVDFPLNQSIEIHVRFGCPWMCCENSLGLNGSQQEELWQESRRWLGWVIAMSNRWTSRKKSTKDLCMIILSISIPWSASLLFVSFVGLPGPASEIVATAVASGGNLRSERGAGWHAKERIQNHSETIFPYFSHVKVVVVAVEACWGLLRLVEACWGLLRLVGCSWQSSWTQKGWTYEKKEGLDAPENSWGLWIEKDRRWKTRGARWSD